MLERPLRQKQLICEGLGTFHLLLAISLVSQNAPVHLQHIGIAATLVSLIFTFGHISKAQFNPAVSLSMWLLGVFPGGLSLPFCFVQLVAGVSGACLGALMGSSTATIPCPPPLTTRSDAGRAFAAEFAFTFLLVMVSLQVALSEQHKNHFFGLAIGCCVAGCIVAAGPISGSVLNPAVTIGLLSAKCAFDGCRDRLTILPLYLAAQLLAGLFGTLVYRMLQPLPCEIAAREAAESMKPTPNSSLESADKMGRANSDANHPNTLLSVSSETRVPSVTCAMIPASPGQQLVNLQEEDELDYDADDCHEADPLCCPPSERNDAPRMVARRRNASWGEKNFSK